MSELEGAPTGEWQEIELGWKQQEKPAPPVSPPKLRTLIYYDWDETLQWLKKCNLNAASFEQALYKYSIPAYNAPFTVDSYWVDKMLADGPAKIAGDFLLTHLGESAQYVAFH